MAALVGVLWLGSIGLTAAVTWHIGRRPEAIPGAHGQPVAPQPSGVSKDDVARLRRENAELRAQVARHVEERREADTERLRLALGQALKEIVEGSPEPKEGYVEATWRRRYETFKSHKDRGAMGGLDKGLTLLADMARLGEPGIRFLADTVSDHQLDMAEREAALTALARIRDRASLAAIMKLREPDIMELDYPYDLILLQVSALSTNEVREFIPGIIRQAGLELGTDTIAPERPEVLAVLAFVHGDRDSWMLLHDERIANENLSGVLQIAADIHTPQSREYLEWLHQSVSDPDVRKTATRLLEQW